MEGTFRYWRAILVEPLTYLLNLPLKTQTFPNDWKFAKICPVSKSGDNSRIENYGPVAVFSALSKVFEIVIYNKVFPSIKSMISPYYHGFFPGRSTLTNIVCFTQFVAKHLDKKQLDDCIKPVFSQTRFP